MAKLILCDGQCGAVSPNPETRLHEANHWLEVEAKREHGGWVHQKRIYCRECAHRVLNAMEPLSKPLPALKPLSRPLLSAAGLFWLCVLATVVWLILKGVGVA